MPQRLVRCVCIYISIFSILPIYNGWNPIICNALLDNITNCWRSHMHNLLSLTRLTSLNEPKSRITLPQYLWRKVNNLFCSSLRPKCLHIGCPSVPIYKVFKGGTFYLQWSHLLKGRKTWGLRNCIKVRLNPTSTMNIYIF